MNNQAKRCFLQNLDKNENVFVFQFAPQTVTMEQSSNIKATPALNRQNPLMQWLHGNMVTVKFQAVLFARSREDEILSQFNQLQSFLQRDETLGRPPVCFWGYGTDVGFKCMVQKLGNVQYGELRSDGTLREIKFDITLFKVSEPELREVESTGRVRTATVKEQ